MTTDNNSAFQAQPLTLADIEKIYETEGAEAADAALCRMRDEREARETAGIVDPPDDWFGDEVGVEGIVAPSDIENLKHALEVGPGETDGEVVEHLDELDAAAEDTEPVAADAAPATVDDWNKPLEFPDLVTDLDSIRKRESYSARKRRFIKDEAKAYRARRTASQQRWRAGVATKQPPQPPKPARFPVKTVTPEMKGRFSEYVFRGDTHLARSLRGRANNLIIALKVFLDGAGELGRDPTRHEFEKAMRWKSKDNGQARRTVTVLSKVFAEGGFGTDAELANGEAAIAKADAAEWAFADAENVSAGGVSTRGVVAL